MAPGLLQPSFSTPLTHTEAHAGFVRRLRGEVDMRHRDQLAANLQCQRATRIGCPRRRGSDSQQWSPCSVVLAWAAQTSPLMTSGSRHPHGRRCHTSRAPQASRHRPFLADTTGRSRRRARRRARARGRSKPARRRPPRPPGLPTTCLRGALPRPRRRRPRRRRALSSSPPRCGRRRTRAAEARQYGGGRRRRS